MLARLGSQSITAKPSGVIQLLMVVKLSRKMITDSYTVLLHEIWITKARLSCSILVSVLELVHTNPTAVRILSPSFTVKVGIT